jgi:hypothetical protein
MFSAEEVFVTDFDTLMAIAGDASLFHNPSETSKTKASEAIVILRRWLLDASPLIHQVNREIKAKITFKVETIDSYEDIEYLSRVAGKRVLSNYIHPDVLGVKEQELSATVRSVTLDEFLKTPINWYQGRLIATVMDVILYYAHIAGAVHRGQPKTDKDKELSEIYGASAGAALPPGLSDIFPISRVVIEAVVPLYAAVRDKVRDQREKSKQQFTQLREETYRSLVAAGATAEVVPRPKRKRRRAGHKGKDTTTGGGSQHRG